MILFYTTFPSKEVAHDICRTLLEEKIIACANISPMESLYWWQGKIESSQEYAAKLKTTYNQASDVERRLKEIHPYEVPCIMRWEFSCNQEYQQWIMDNLEKADT